MAMVNVQVWDATGNKRQTVEMPDDAPINRILAVLLERMKFPQYAPDGQPLSYKFHHRASGKQLLDEQTLSDVGVKEGDVLRLQPEITAGSVILSAGVLAGVEGSGGSVGESLMSWGRWIGGNSICRRGSALASLGILLRAS